ncbi:MAG: glycosyltransferase [Desulfuromonadales bacterium]|nr:glycosyltransferase [Desulfuromonadales bacterium]
MSRTAQQDVGQVSVVVINYNGLARLQKALPSITALEGRPEIICVDNGSSDGSLELLAATEGVTLLKSPRPREKNFACNYGAQHATGRYILLLDNDVVLTEPDILQRLIERYQSNADTGAISLAYVNEGATQSRGYGAPLGYYFIKEVPELALSEVMAKDAEAMAFPMGIAVFIEKELWQQAGGYDDFLKFGGDDNDLGIRLQMMGRRNYLYAKGLQVHVGMSERADNALYALKLKEMFFAHLYTVFKNYALLNMLITLCGLSLFGLLKSLKQGLCRRSFSVFWAVFAGFLLFLKNLPHASAKRRQIQAWRKVKEDVFLKS